MEAAEPISKGQFIIEYIGEGAILLHYLAILLHFILFVYLFLIFYCQFSYSVCQTKGFDILFLCPDPHLAAYKFTNVFLL